MSNSLYWQLPKNAAEDSEGFQDSNILNRQSSESLLVADSEAA